MKWLYFLETIFITGYSYSPSASEGGNDWEERDFCFLPAATLRDAHVLQCGESPLGGSSQKNFFFGLFSCYKG